MKDLEIHDIKGSLATSDFDINGNAKGASGMQVSLPKKAIQDGQSKFIFKFFIIYELKLS